MYTRQAKQVEPPRVGACARVELVAFPLRGGGKPSGSGSSRQTTRGENYGMVRGMGHPSGHAGDYHAGSTHSTTDKSQGRIIGDLAVGIIAEL